MIQTWKQDLNIQFAENDKCVASANADHANQLLHTPGDQNTGEQGVAAKMWRNWSPFKLLAGLQMVQLMYKSWSKH